MTKKILIAVLILIGLFVVSYASSKLVNISDNRDKIAVIPITGVITIDGGGIGFESQGASSTDIVQYIQEANKNSNVKGILLEINSPGGSAVASKEIADAVKNSKKPVVSWIREVGASGAYWISSSSKLIVADPLSITGSIGVTGSYLEFSDLFEKYGVTYERLVSGKYKDTGSPYKELNDDEKRLLQDKINQIHEVFVDQVAGNRKLNRNEVEKLATGEFYLGKEAYDLGLVDYLGGKDLALNLTKQLAGIKEAELIRYEKKRGIFDIVGGLTAKNFYYMGKGIGSEIKTSSYEIPVRLE
nr:signal peptide peptidase SppA [Candidatus Woesearchaeota archaeon]